ncbi:hypothetical protein AX14_004022 [Amanita brunnescens Koide BX004]|nr:hypothetical protein AX14_004022 [Amanita brunnescens Koide BX004]
MKELSDSVWKSFSVGPSRIPIPVSASSRRSSTSSRGPISRQSSIYGSAPMSRRASASSFTGSPLDGRIGHRSPNTSYRYVTDLRYGREEVSPPAAADAWSLEELQASIELEKRDIAVQTDSGEDIQHDLDDYLISLLAVLRNKDTSMPMSTVANIATVGLVRELLDVEDVTNIVAKLSSLPDSDVQTFLDFIIYLLDNNFLLKKGANEINRKARRFALKLLKRKPIMLRSLLLPEVMMKTDNQEIGRGGFAFVLKGEMQGRPVALKVLHSVRHTDDFCREAFIWRTFSHEHVLALLGIHENPLGRFLVSPYMENGTLSSWRKKKTSSSAEVQQRVRVYRNVHAL